MVRDGRRSLVPMVLGIALALLGSPLAGCYTVQEGELPPAAVLAMRATIVDLNAHAGSVMVKENESRETWRVAVLASTRIRAADGRDIGLEELRLGEKVEIRGTSRIENLITAYEISSFGERPAGKDEELSR